ncbi:DsbA family protein [Marinobacterium aestuariivivens]|uniref:DsbA family protein n=1 Tax=Marinobacterium aestuariivivens TaxID=1698799 RepID=A0ABW2A336_9GAMM
MRRFAGISTTWRCSTFWGLAPDTEAPMPAPLQQQIQATWRHIEARTGTPFNHDFWRLNQPRRATWSACRAVISAGRIETGADERMVAAIQRAYYLEARNPSDADVLVALAQETGLDPERFRGMLQDPDTERQLQRHLALKDKLGVQGFPALLLQHGDDLLALSAGYDTASGLIPRIRKRIREP